MDNIYYTKPELYKIICEIKIPDVIIQIIHDYTYAEKLIIKRSYSVYELVNDSVSKLYPESFCIYNDCILYACNVAMNSCIMCYNSMECKIVQNLYARPSLVIRYPSYFNDRVLLVPKFNGIYIYNDNVTQYAAKYRLNNDFKLVSRKRKKKFKVYNFDWNMIGLRKNKIKPKRIYMLTKSHKFKLRLSGDQLLLFDNFRPNDNQIIKILNSTLPILIIEQNPYWIRIKKMNIFIIYNIIYLADYTNKESAILVQFNLINSECISAIPFDMKDKRIRFIDCTHVNNNNENIVIKTSNSNMIYEFTRIVY